MAVAHWLISGVSSGFGRVLAQAALARGDSVAGTLRDPAQLAAFEQLAPGRAHGVLLDVTDPAQVAAGVALAQQRLGRIDVLVNNAGYGLFGAVEETAEDEARRVMETNFFGTLRLSRAVLPLLRRQGAGRIVNFSSLAGLIGIPGVGLYSAAKHAVEGLSESLAAELAPLGIRVILVEPGGFRTDFAGRSMTLVRQPLADYDATPAGRTRDNIARYSGHEPGDPARAMAVVLQAVDAAEPPLRLVLGEDAMQATRAKLARVAADLDHWAAASRGTAFSA